MLFANETSLLEWSLFYTDLLFWKMQIIPKVFGSSTIVTTYSFFLNSFVFCFIIRGEIQQKFNLLFDN